MESYLSSINLAAALALPPKYTTPNISHNKRSMFIYSSRSDMNVAATQTLCVCFRRYYSLKRHILLRPRQPGNANVAPVTFVIFKNSPIRVYHVFNNFPCSAQGQGAMEGKETTLSTVRASVSDGLRGLSLLNGNSQRC